MIRITLNALGKIVISGIIAFMILTVFSFLYYNLPLNSINKDGSTDVKHTANAFYSQGKEGFAWGKTNNDGFNNLFDYDDGMKIDVLIMGSSQMQAYNVDMSQSTASQLNALLENKTVYNVSNSGYMFLACARNLRAALNKYRPTKYVVIETGSVSFSDEDIALVVNEGTIDLQSLNHEGGIRGLLRRSCYLRLIYRQILDYNIASQPEAEDIESPGTFTESDTAAHEKLLDNLFHKMNTLAEEYGTKVIIAYHPGINIAPDGAISLDDDQNTIAQFRRASDANGVLFLNMSDRFKEEYENTYILPHGFSNTPVGKGHLNKYGHAMIADELYKLILEGDQ